MTKAEREERAVGRAVGRAIYDQAIKNQVLDILAGHPCLYLVISHRTKSGMQRSVKAYGIAGYGAQGPQLVELTWNVCKILELRFDSTNGGAIVRGCGMDMGYWLAEGLSHALYGEGRQLTHKWL